MSRSLVFRMMMLVMALGSAQSAQAAAPAIRRLALVVGANDGGPGRFPLRYAVSDAEAFSRVLRDLGGVAPQDSKLLQQPSRAELLAAIDAIDTSAAHKGATRVEAIFYFSGHSDETGLMLGRDRLTYSELRQAIDRVRTDVRITVLDSCASGAMLRTKGGRHLAPFLMEESSAVKGHAILTASAADESAQESDRIQSSFFTSALIMGLRGAADTSRDRKVTLNEAYAYAFNDTLARTTQTLGGAQHPAYDIKLTGTGDLVMTDLRATPSTLRLDTTLSGTVFLHRPDGSLVGEFRKVEGQETELGMEAGPLTVVVQGARGLMKAEIALASGDAVALSMGDLRPTAGERVAARGGPDVSPDSATREVDASRILGRWASFGFDTSEGARMLDRLELGALNWDDMLLRRPRAPLVEGGDPVLPQTPRVIGVSGGEDERPSVEGRPGPAIQARELGTMRRREDRPLGREWNGGHDNRATPPPEQRGGAIRHSFGIAPGRGWQPE